MQSTNLIPTSDVFKRKQIEAELQRRDYILAFEGTDFFGRYQYYPKQSNGGQRTVFVDPGKGRVEIICTKSFGEDTPTIIETLDDFLGHVSDYCGPVPNEPSINRTTARLRESSARPLERAL